MVTGLKGTVGATIVPQIEDPDLKVTTLLRVTHLSASSLPRNPLIIEITKVGTTSETERVHLILQRKGMTKQQKVTRKCVIVVSALITQQRTARRVTIA